MRLIDAEAYMAEMHNRQEAAEDWIKSSTGANQIRAKATFLAYCEAALTLKNMPTIDAVPVVHGKWVKQSGSLWPVGHCSLCDELVVGTNRTNYCPWCGAKMDGGAK